MEVNDDFCGARTNVGIGSRYPLQSTANVTSDEHIATSIGVLEYQSKTIVILGTRAGKVVKVGTDMNPLKIPGRCLWR